MNESINKAETCPQQKNTSSTELALSTLEIGNLSQPQMHRELRNLRFINPGEAVAISTEETICSKQGVRRSTRHRKVMTTVDRVTDHIPHHDEEGYLIRSDGRTVRLCDCLRVSCPGCHYPCEKCGSRLCGPGCQKNRDYIIESFFTDAEQPRIRKHPYYHSHKRES
uniref:ARF7 effector protein C-terminal domain-containing protein n=1 Tax=Setaria digitata TaxID=48799 RepID=A0A915PM77_9BILA